MILKKIRVGPFKRVRKVELELADLTILVGANGSGKSSIIQAVHLACCVMRQAPSVAPGKTSTIGIEELDYLPTENYRMLGHRSAWGNKEGTPSSKVELTFASGASEATASCELRSARNAGISITGSIPPALTSALRNKNEFFSAYIPGISGIPNKEERRSQKVVLRACSYGDSNIILRNALRLLQQKDATNISKIESWIGQIIGPIQIRVRHEEESDLVIGCTATLKGDTRPIELIGTGYLQLIQIFAYVLLFKPGVLLIDEPDIHLHPTAQEKLAAVLGAVARAQKMRILLTTHSPFIVRGAPLNTRVYWLDRGAVASERRAEVELLLGWGAFGKKAIVISEDTDTTLLRALIKQWPEIDRGVAFYPGTGYAHLPTPEQARSIKDALGGKYNIIVHRDRDSLSDFEAAQIIDQYDKRGVHLWFTKLSDIEAYFCLPKSISELTGCSTSRAAAAVDGVLAKHAQPIGDQFKKQRVEHNKELHGQGGGPTNAAVWAAFQLRPLKGAKGKFVLGQLRSQAFPGNAMDEDAIVRHKLSGRLAMDLKKFLRPLT